MRKVIGMGFLKSLPVVAVLAITLAIASTALAGAPPYGIDLGDTWAVEGLDEVAAYSFSPIPDYREDTTYGPNLILTPGTKFEFYYGFGVEIRKLDEWKGMAVHRWSGPAAYEGIGDGTYTFNEPGFYIISFAEDLVILVEVAGNTVAAPVLPANEIKVMLDGKLLSFDVPPQIINGRTLVPLRVIFEALGASVSWDEASQSVGAVKGDTRVSLRIGSNLLVRNGSSVTMDVPPQLIDNRTMVPARAVAESFGAQVDWDSATQTVIITSSAAAYPPPANHPSSSDGGYGEVLNYYREFTQSSYDRDTAIENLVARHMNQLGTSSDRKLYELECSAFEAYDTNNLGYALHDINSDGIPELFIITDEYYDFSDFIYAIYTLRNGRPFLVEAYWSRNWCALDITGVVYVYGSNGAEDSSSATYLLDSVTGELRVIRPEVDLSEFPDSPTKGLTFMPLS